MTKPSEDFRETLRLGSVFAGIVVCRLKVSQMIVKRTRFLIDVSPSQKDSAIITDM